jgi:hypothetical protein
VALRPSPQVLTGTSNRLYDSLSLMSSAKVVLGPLFKNNFDFDISKITSDSGFTGSAAAVTFHNTVTIERVALEIR